MIDISLILSILIFVFGITLSFIVGGNNSAISLGILVSTNVMKRKYSYLVSAISIFLGASVGSLTMFKSVHGIVNTSDELIAKVIIVCILFSSILSFFYLNRMGVPTALSQMIYSSLAVISLVTRIAFLWSAFLVTLVSWMVSPLVAIISALLLYRLVHVFLKNTKGIIEQVKYYRVIILIASALTSFVTGANAVGIIISTGLFALPEYIIVPCYALAAAIGIYLSSWRAVITVGFRVTKLGYASASSALIGSALVSEVFTVFSVPISITQTVMGGIIGLSFRSLTSDIEKQLKQIGRGWLLSPTFSIIVSLALYGIIRSILGF
ncbi:inorganic phosphate transporter [Sulfolobus acidocaldarius]|uniref:Phosphate transporter n=1 Tax=Sulfolobus acidocaldarius Ron12/I TaxID=1028567 RepID=M1J9Q1_9CREN|nr:inorganic phosphate transporter [Sulfolobus acidocaldarius]AGE72515.1 phosphate transporter [Sulfolobus acidocaldarius Ron12/I]